MNIRVFDEQRKRIYYPDSFSIKTNKKTKRAIVQFWIPKENVDPAQKKYKGSEQIYSNTYSYKTPGMAINGPIFEGDFICLTSNPDIIGIVEMSEHLGGYICVLDNKIIYMNRQMPEVEIIGNIFMDYPLYEKVKENINAAGEVLLKELEEKSLERMPKKATVEEILSIAHGPDEDIKEGIMVRLVDQKIEDTLISENLKNRLADNETNSEDSLADLNADRLLSQVFKTKQEAEKEDQFGLIGSIFKDSDDKLTGSGSAAQSSPSLSEIDENEETKTEKATKTNDAENDTQTNEVSDSPMKIVAENDDEIFVDLHDLSDGELGVQGDEDTSADLVELGEDLLFDNLEQGPVDDNLEPVDSLEMEMMDISDVSDLPVEDNECLSDVSLDTQNQEAKQPSLNEKPLFVKKENFVEKSSSESADAINESEKERGNQGNGSPEDTPKSEVLINPIDNENNSETGQGELNVENQEEEEKPFDPLAFIKSLKNNNALNDPEPPIEKDSKNNKQKSSKKNKKDKKEKEVKSKSSESKKGADDKHKKGALSTPAEKESSKEDKNLKKGNVEDKKSDNKDSRENTEAPSSLGEKAKPDAEIKKENPSAETIPFTTDKMLHPIEEIVLESDDHNKIDDRFVQPKTEKTQNVQVLDKRQTPDAAETKVSQDESIKEDSSGIKSDLENANKPQSEGVLDSKEDFLQEDLMTKQNTLNVIKPDQENENSDAETVKKKRIGKNLEATIREKVNSDGNVEKKVEINFIKKTPETKIQPTKEKTRTQDSDHKDTKSKEAEISNLTDNGLNTEPFENKGSETQSPTVSEESSQAQLKEAAAQKDALKETKETKEMEETKEIKGLEKELNSQDEPPQNKSSETGDTKDSLLNESREETPFATQSVDALIKERESQRKDTTNTPRKDILLNANNTENDFLKSVLGELETNANNNEKRENNKKEVFQEKEALKNLDIYIGVKQENGNGFCYAQAGDLYSKFYVKADNENHFYLMALQLLLQRFVKYRRITLSRIHTDILYLLKPFEEGWLESWSKNDWKKANGEKISYDKNWKTVWQILSKNKVILKAATAEDLADVKLKAEEMFNEPRE